MAPSQKIRIVIRSFDHHIIDQAASMIIEAAERAGAEISGPIPMPTKIKKYTVLRSTFVHKNHREQFESRTHKRVIDINKTTPNTLAELTGLSLPAGVEIEVKM